MKDYKANYKTMLLDCSGIIVSFLSAWLFTLKFSKYMVYPSELMKDSFLHSLVIIPLYMVLHITKNRYHGKGNFLSSILNICKYNALGVLLLCFMLYNFELNSNFWSLFPSSVMYLFFIINTMLELLARSVYSIKTRSMGNRILHENTNLAAKLGRTE